MRRMWDDWVQFLTSKADEYFPKRHVTKIQSGTVCAQTHADGQKSARLSFDIVEIESDRKVQRMK
jgi:hypothetical protein